VVEQERRLRSCGLLEGHGCRLGSAFGLDVDRGDLAAGKTLEYSAGDRCIRTKSLPEAEEVLDLLIISVGCDVRNLDNIGRHIGC
jgi:hypothetical protein